MGSINIFKPLSTVLSTAINKAQPRHEKNFGERRTSNLRLLGGKQVCYLCAMQPPYYSNVCFNYRQRHENFGSSGRWASGSWPPTARKELLPCNTGGRSWTDRRNREARTAFGGRAGCRETSDAASTASRTHDFASELKTFASTLESCVKIQCNTLFCCSLSGPEDHIFELQALR